MTALLEVTGLSKTYKARGLKARRAMVPAVADVSFSVEAGHTLALVGESGAGKSTTGLLSLRLDEPDAGSIMFDGQDVRQLSSRDLRSWRRRAQMVFQDPFGSFDPRMTIGQSLVEPMVIHEHLRRGDRHAAAVRVLEQFGMGAAVLDRYPYEFSGGQLQRLAIARAISCAPALLVCDEPVAALDMSIQAQILNLLRDLQTEVGFAMLFISHDLSLVRAVADDIAVMYAGRIVEFGPVKQIYGSPSHPYTKALLSAVPVPNPLVQRNRQAIPLTEVATAPVVGCAFSPRCPDVMEVCLTERPALIRREDETEVACHLVAARGTPSIGDEDAVAVAVRLSVDAPGASNLNGVKGSGTAV
jgi:oligopeptide transport system ATP-binding protein